MDIAYRLAANAVTRQFTDLSPLTLTSTSDSLIDSLACALAGRGAPGLAAARQGLRRWGTSDVTLWGGYGKSSAPVAAFLNAGAMHALDYDDTDDKVPLHANSVVLPALLADLEENHPDCSGREFLTALAVGLDGAMRVGRAGGPKGSRGWNYSVISGGMGAVLALARLRRWNAEKTVHALGHQLAQTSGSLQSIIDGSLAKRFQPALVAKSVIMSTTLAEAGIDGPVNVFEGKAGFINLYQDGTFHLDKIEEGMKNLTLVEDLSLKPYPACRFTHSSVDLALQMHAEGLRPAQIERIRVLASGQAFNMVGRKYDATTATVVDAQFSIAYTTSVGLHKGSVLIGDFTEESIRNTATGSFAKERMEIVVNDKAPFLGMVPTLFEVQLKDGTHRKLCADTVTGSPEKRMTDAQFRAKIDDCLTYGRSSVGTDELIDGVRALCSDAPVRGLIAILARGDR